ncbi:hypothetical protein DV738_g5124, partial [Chaetothyriales sp. CBS 135597]
MLLSQQKITGQSGRTYQLICPLGTQGGNDFPNVWKAVDDANDDEEFVVKSPSSDDDETHGWPLFQHEFEMQKLFGDSPFVRKMVDFVPPAPNQEPLLVLQAFEKTLWDARWQRPMTTDEIKWIMKAVLLGLWTVHRKGLVYTDLKMENVLLNGFKNEKPGNVRSLIARIADCGTKVHFGIPWTASTDLWSWGIMYCHLLEAQTDFKKPGIYDSISKGTLDDKALAVRKAIAFDFDLYSNPIYSGAESKDLLPPEPDSGLFLGSDRWMDRLRSKGVSDVDIEFLSLVLDPDPEARWTAQEIIATGYLEIG